MIHRRIINEFDLLAAQLAHLTLAKHFLFQFHREISLAALNRLPERARQVLVLRHFAGCSHEEIARLLAIQVGTSKSQLHRARTLLRRELEPPSGETHDH